ncbi:MAG: BlaI/MecI/CopY family transcriptional regulator [Planctomycetes bacterium]|nr:BlaI/MecI/CopY family transcriptional regulator [Phycisphaerae bacterium]NBB95154.1 BlaI/MecI/CopY family transcriptional regulator [Planctomycetota bacterium]
MATEHDTRPRPSDGELAILRVLWGRGPSTVRQVHEAIGDRGVRYTTTLKIMQVMAEKGLVERDEANRSHVYSAAIEEVPTQRRLLSDFLDKAFGGSAGKLVMQALAAGDISAEELREIRKLLKEKGAGHEHAR